MAFQFRLPEGWLHCIPNSFAHLQHSAVPALGAFALWNPQARFVELGFVAFDQEPVAENADFHFAHFGLRLRCSLSHHFADRTNSSSY